MQSVSTLAGLFGRDSFSTGTTCTFHQMNAMFQLENVSDYNTSAKGCDLSTRP